MKVCVLGAGAIGSMLGGLIRRHDPTIDVLLVGRGEHAHAIRDSGHIGLEGSWGLYTVPIQITGDVAALADADLVLLTVKSHATEEAVKSASPYLGDAIVVSIQNGINCPLLLQHVRPERLVLGMTATNMAVLRPGRVSLQLDGATILGTPPGQNGPAAASLARAVELLRKSGLRIEAHDNVLGVQYNKLAVNALGYASCLSASNFITEGILHRPWRKAVAIPILDECLAAFDRAGIRLASIPGVPSVRSFRRWLSLLGVPGGGAIVSSFARQRFNRKPIVFSLYQDLLRHKPTEIDFINGEIVRLAREHGGDAPFNAAVVEMVHELESRGNGTFFSRDEVVQNFRRLRNGRS
jgi:2-dehydropantoate 2-reductase